MVRRMPDIQEPHVAPEEKPKPKKGDCHVCVFCVDKECTHDHGDDPCKGKFWELAHPCHTCDKPMRPLSDHHGYCETCMEKHEFEFDYMTVQLTKYQLEFLQIILTKACLGSRDNEGREIVTPTLKSHEHIKDLAETLKLWDEDFKVWWEYTKRE